MLYADGKVITPLFRAKPGDRKVDKATGVVRYPRAEHDAALQRRRHGGDGVGHEVRADRGASSPSAQPIHSRRRPLDETRERAVRMVQEARQRPGEAHGAVIRIAKQLGVGTESLRNRVNQVDVDAGGRSGTSSANLQRIAELERECASCAERTTS